MLFNSLAFVIFFPLVIAGYFLLPARFRNVFLLLASCYFYMYFNPVYILILAYTIAVDYIAGIKIEFNTGNRKLQKRWLYASLIANLGALGIFKYANFIGENISALFQLVPANASFSLWHILLPIGLSFHTFQAISYTVEVYRGKQKAERNVLVYSLYVMFFPQLVAGPIERPQRLLHQFKEEHHFLFENFSIGAKWILWGLFKKIVVADNLSMLVDAVYNSPQSHTGWALITATVLFAFQIYGDFSGYSDIAKGTAKILGFDLSINFDLPYFSSSVSEFWRRWHVSLSSWFKEYVYVPLGGNKERFFRNLFITFALSGLWHGANYTYLVWGILNGIFVFMDKYLSKISIKVPTVLKMTMVFFLIDFCWIFFRASSLSDASYIVTHAFSDLSWRTLKTIDVERHVWLIGLVMLAFMLAVEWFTKTKSVILWWHETARGYKIIFLNLLLILMLLFGVFEHRTFIYFQF
ncbi:MAG: MBOAT family protein [Bacteroidetes bacterium]|nr:MBOAT family protein [Bacteroidota bacterium]